MGLFRGAVFGHGGGAGKQPIKQPTEMLTSTMALMGRFPSLMGRFLTLMGRFPDFALRGRFTSWKSTGKQPIKKRGIKRFLSTGRGEPRGPESWKNKSRLNAWKFQVFAWNFKFSLENFNLDLENSPQKWGFGGWLAWKFQSRLKMSFVSISLENFNPGGRSWIFSRVGPFGKWPPPLHFRP